MTTLRYINSCFLLYNLLLSIMSTISRAQLQTLAVLRTLLRHARTTSANCPVAIAAAASHAAKTGGNLALALPVPAADASVASGDAAGLKRIDGGWAAFIMAQYRAKAGLSKRSEIKSARDSAKDLAQYLVAVSEQAALTEAYRGADVDSNDQRRNVARFVGLDMPQVPEGAQLAPLAERYTAAAVDKYADTLASRLGGSAAGSSAAAGAGSGASATSGNGSDPSGTRLTGLDAIKAQYYGVASLSPTLQAAQAQQATQAQAAAAATTWSAGGSRGGAVVPPAAMDPTAAAAAKAAASAAYAERLKTKAAAKAAAATAGSGTL